MRMKTYQRLAGLLGAIKNCQQKIDNCQYEGPTCGTCDNAEAWIERHQDSIDTIMQGAPTGSGFDCGTQLEQLSAPCSTSERLVFTTAYHHMNDGGYYDGWTYHSVIVTPSLQFGYNLRVTGKDRNGIKEYIAECFSSFLDKEVSV